MREHDREFFREKYNKKAEETMLEMAGLILSEELMQEFESAAEDESLPVPDEAARNEIRNAVSFAINKNETRLRRLETKRKWKVRARKAGNFAAGFVAVVMIGVGVALLPANAMRNDFIDFFLEKFDEFSQIHLGSSANLDISENWYDKYAPSYVPEGFHYVDTITSKISSDTYFQNASGKEFSISIAMVMDGINIDTENAVKSLVNFKSYELTIHTKPNYCSVIFPYDSKFIMIDGQISKDEVVKIAKSIIDP